MSQPPANLERVPEAMRDPVQEYVRLIKQIAGDNAKALVLYGAVVDGPFDDAVHTARSILVPERVDLEVLRRISECGPQLGKQRISAPLVMTSEHVRTSCDTFPLEFIEIQQHHVTLFGESPFEPLSFKNDHVRLQCERELKVLLIGMRQGLLVAAGRKKMLGALEVDVGDGLLRTLRGLLWLKDAREARPGSAVVAEVEKRFERPLPGVRAALDRGGEHGWSQFQTLYQDLEALEGIVDAL